jgi:Spy/CpxP family protein refolding chaperone
MKKSTILASATVGLVVLSTSLFAGNYSEMGHNKNMMKHHKMMKNPIMPILKKLNLSNEQRNEIRQIMRNSNKNRKTLNDVFTKDTFDKEMFIKIMSEKRENMIKSKADKIEKIYDVLDDKQKNQFKTLLELRTEKMLKRGKGFDKNCHDRR